jgi:hypothetical protein
MQERRRRRGKRRRLCDDVDKEMWEKAEEQVKRTEMEWQEYTICGR